MPRCRRRSRASPHLRSADGSPIRSSRQDDLCTCCCWASPATRGMPRPSSEQLEASWTARDATNLASMIAADLQLRGPSRMAWVDAKYMGDRQRSTRELEAALLALSVLGNANDAIPRERVIQSYLMFMRSTRSSPVSSRGILRLGITGARSPVIPRADQIECPATFCIARRDLRLFATKPGQAT